MNTNSYETTPLVPHQQKQQHQQGVSATTTTTKQTQKKEKKQDAPTTRRNSDGSLDFERIVNGYSIQAKRDQWKRDVALKNNTRPTSSGAGVSKNTIRWILTLGCALISGSTTVMIVWATEKLVEWRRVFLAQSLTRYHQSNNDSYQYWIVFGGYVLISLILADMAALLCLYWPGVPEAIGSGIPEVKSYLNGIRVKKFNNPTLLWVKMIGSVLSVGSSMAVGMEGPLVMIGAYAGATLAHIGTSLSSLTLKIIRIKHAIQKKKQNCCTTTKNDTANNDQNTTESIRNMDQESSMSPTLHRFWIFCTCDLCYFANDAERRKLITIGAACGFAASFGAPIGGMLFILDDISTFFQQDMFLRILVANAVGTFCLAYYKGDLSYYGAINFADYTGKKDDSIENQFMEVPWWILLGILLGTLGGIFCKAYGIIKKWSGKRFNTPGLCLFWVTYISLINSVIMFVLPTMIWVCHDIPSNLNVTDIQAEQQFFCDEGQTNQMAVIFFGSRGKAIVSMLSHPEDFYISTLFIVGVVFYTLMLYSNTCSFPSGLFTPIVLSGAALGGSYGLLLERYVDENFEPSTFALLGVAAMMAGIQRSTVSTCVILVEGTGQMKVLLPVMIVVVVANYAAYFIHKDGIYEVLIKLKGYPYLEHGKDQTYDIFTASDVMSHPPVLVHLNERAKSLVKTLKSTTHCGFPVVDSHGRFMGLVRRKQIIALMECGMFEKFDPEGNMTSSRLSYMTGDQQEDQKGLMHYAYQIKDDRYNGVPVVKEDDDASTDDDEEDLKATNFSKETDSDALSEKVNTTETKVGVNKRRSGKVLWGKLRTKTKAIGTIKKVHKGLVGGDISMPINFDDVYSNENFLSHHFDDDRGIHGSFEDLGGDEEIEELARVSHYKEHDDTDACNSDSSTLQSMTKTNGTKKYVNVGWDRKKNVVIVKWLNPEYNDDIIDLEAVMNRGAYTIPANFPLSKAYNLFTLLGLRWIVVVNLEGGTVVGILTRESFLDSHVKEKTGIDVNDLLS